VFFGYHTKGRLLGALPAEALEGCDVGRGWVSGSEGGAGDSDPAGGWLTASRNVLGAPSIGKEIGALARLDWVRETKGALTTSVGKW
jgi:hypothetical protein